MTKFLIFCYIVLAVGVIAFLITNAVGWLALSAFPGCVLYFYCCFWYVHDYIAAYMDSIRE